MLKKIILTYVTVLVLLLLFICIFVFPTIIKNDNLIITNPKDFTWPTPNCNIITSYFGYRTAPATGASTYHSGIDIGAPEGTFIHSICDGYVSFTGFSGANGYTVTIKSEPYLISYCHVNPIFEVEVSEFVSKGEKIAKVGPKYVEQTTNNPYKDSSRKINKWSNNWTSFTFNNKKRRSTN